MRGSTSTTDYSNYYWVLGRIQCICSPLSALSRLAMQVGLLWYATVILFDYAILVIIPYGKSNRWILEFLVRSADP